MRILLTLVGSLLLLTALFVPWWVATARLPGGNARVQLNLYSFQFESADFSCTAILIFYSYGNCPLLGSDTGVAALTFYLFWSLVFLLLSAALGLASAVSAWSGHGNQILWLPLVSPVLGALCSLSFIAAISTAGLKFVGWNPLYGSSSVLTWNVSAGLFLAIGSVLILLVGARLMRRGA